MVYQDLVDAAKAYADRNDIEVNDNMDVFIMMAEARINRRLKVRKQTHRVYTRTMAHQEYYSLPKDYAGMRTLHLNTGEPGEDSATINVDYINPNEFNDIDDNFETNRYYYTIIANQIQVHPLIERGTLEITYYRRVTNLSESEPSNWLSQDNPDIYLSGMLAEIESFVKNYDAAQLWDSKMSRSIDELEQSDVEERWTGSVLTMRVG